MSNQRDSIVRFFLTLLVVWSVFSARVADAAQPSKPNIIFIMLDDAGPGDFSSYYSTPVQTPRIQELAEEGMKFTRAYAGSTVCAPSRASLLTGKHSGHAYVRANASTASIRQKDVTIAEVLKEAGYRTGGFGKWGVGSPGTPGAPELQGFDVFLGTYHQIHAHSHYTSRLYKEGKRYPLPENVGFSEPNVGRVSATRWYVHYEVFDAMKEFIVESANAGEPFFAYGTWTPPHNKSTIPADEPAYDLYANQPWSEEAKIQATMISVVDRQVGEIVDLVASLGIADDTLIMFCSDHGGYEASVGSAYQRNGDLRGAKGSMYEGGLRTPLVAYWPGEIQPGSVSDLLTYFPDMMPTFAQVAGASAFVPEDTDGVSIVPTLTGVGTQESHEFLFFEYYTTNYGAGVINQDPRHALVMGDYKAVRNGTSKSIELYNLIVDPSEKTNIAGANPGLVNEIAGIFASEPSPTPPHFAKVYTSSNTGEYTYGVRALSLELFGIENGSFESPALDPSSPNLGMLQRGGIDGWSGGVVVNPGNALLATGVAMFTDPMPDGVQAGVLWPGGGAEGTLSQTLADGSGTGLVLYLEDLHREFEVDMHLGRRIDAGTSSESAIANIEIVGGASGFVYFSAVLDTGNLARGEWSHVKLLLNVTPVMPATSKVGSDLGKSFRLRIRHTGGNGHVFVDDVKLKLKQACFADLNGDGVLDIFDYLAFQDAFVKGEPMACDCDTSTGGGVCDVFDFLCFQDAFSAGCS